MEAKPITTETAKVNLLPILSFKQNKKLGDGELRINTTIAIPAGRTADVLVSSKLVPADDEILLIQSATDIGCIVSPSHILPGRIPKELVLIFMNVSNGVFRLEANKVMAIVKAIPISKSEKQNG